MPLLWLAVVVGAPVGEEIFFRGFLFAGLAKSRLGGTGAIVLSSLAWAVIHVQYDPFDMAYIFLLGLVIGAFRLKTNSLWPPILMHALVNLIAMIQTAWLLGM
jgi:membrane protease YdiL (CAAX protease family)